MTKRINVLGIVYLAVAMAVVQYGTGLFLSPAVTRFVVDNLNYYSPAKVLVEKAAFWPLTLSVSVKGVKVFDPENKEIIASADTMDMRLSVMAALARRIKFNKLTAYRAELYLSQRPDGSVNIEGIFGAKDKDTAGSAPWLQVWKEKKDIIGKAYDLLKKKFDGGAAAKRAGERKAGGKVQIAVKEMPKGKVVAFKPAKGVYALSFGEIDMVDSRIRFTGAKKEAIDIENARVRLKDIGYDKDNGFKMNGFTLAGKISKEGRACGDVSLKYDKELLRDGEKDALSVKAREVSLKDVRFIYQDSIPVIVDEGKIDLVTETVITNGALESANSFSLYGHSIKAKAPNDMVFNIIPMSTLCDTVNGINPVDMKFRITGTIERPEFKDFEKTLMALLAPRLGDLSKQAVQKGADLLSGLLKKAAGTDGQGSGEGEKAKEDVDKALGAIKGLFK